MSGFSIGINALRTAQYLVDIAGDNIANANTPGYHAKRAVIVSEIGRTTGQFSIGMGARIEDVVRLRNELIERALLANIQVHGRLEPELEALRQLEGLLDEPTDGGLDARLGQFFECVAQLAADPDNPVVRQQVVQAACSVCETLNRLDSEMSALARSFAMNVDDAIAQVNDLTARIAELNDRIRVIETGGVRASSLKDTRDQLMAELAGLINVTTHQDDFGVVNVSCLGILIVDGNRNVRLDRVETDEGFAVAVEGPGAPLLKVQQGRLAGLLNVVNEFLPRYRAALDELADGFRRSVNLIQTTGLGSQGRFHSLDGLNAFPTDEPFYTLGYGVAAGTAEKLVINVEDESTGEITQYELTLDTTQGAADFLLALRDAINGAVGGVTASIEQGRLKLQAADGYAFGFATPYDPNPAEPGDITAASPTSPLILDAYSGETDLEYEFNFVTGGEIGADSITIQINVREPGGGPVLRTITRQLDADYSAGGAIVLENGLKFSLSEGNVSAGDSFSFVAHASMDTAGVLDALGLNVFLNGLGAEGIHVVDRLQRDPSALGAALSEMPGDNHRLLDLSNLRSEKVLGDGTATLSEHYRNLLTDIGVASSTRSVHLQAQERLLKTIENSRDSVSGVSIEEEMIRIIQCQRLYQGAIKYVQILDGFLSDLLNLV